MKNKDNKDNKGIKPVPGPIAKIYYLDYNYKYGPLEYNPGDNGHALGQGWYIANEEGKRVFLNENENEYKRLFEKFLK